MEPFDKPTFLVPKTPLIPEHHSKSEMKMEWLKRWRLKFFDVTGQQRFLKGFNGIVEGDGYFIRVDFHLAKYIDSYAAEHVF